MMKFQISLDAKTFDVLRKLSTEEFRDHRQEASLLIHEALVNRGLLTDQEYQTFHKVENLGGGIGDLNSSEGISR